MKILDLKKDMMKAKKDKDPKAKYFIMLVDLAQKNLKENPTKTEDECITQAAKRLVKMTKESLEAGMDVKEELNFYESFLPKVFDEAKLKHIITEFKNDNPGANMGQIMGYLKKNFGDQIDMKMASKLAKEL